LPSLFPIDYPDVWRSQLESIPLLEGHPVLHFQLNSTKSIIPSVYWCEDLKGEQSIIHVYPAIKILICIANLACDMNNTI